MTEQVCCYLDWTPLPRRAANFVRGLESTNNTQVMTLTLDTAYRKLFLDQVYSFASKLRGGSPHRPAEEARAIAEKDDEFELVRTLGAVDVLTSWLREGTGRSLSAGIDPGGYIFILIRFDLPEVKEEDSNPETLDLSGVAMALAHIVKVALTDDPNQPGMPQSLNGSNIVVGDDKSPEVYRFPSTLIWPIEIELDPMDGEQDQDVCKRALQSAELLNLVPAKNSLGLVEPEFAIVQLASRYGDVLDKHLNILGRDTAASDQVLPEKLGLIKKIHQNISRLFQFEMRGEKSRVKDESDISDSEIEISNGTAIFERISATFIATSMFLAGSFLILLWLPSLMWLKLFGKPGNESAWFDTSKGENAVLCVIFFLLCLIRLIAVYGVRIIADEHNRSEPLGLLERASGWLAGVVFKTRWRLWTAPILMALAFCVAYKLEGTDAWFNKFIAFSGPTEGRAIYSEILSSLIWVLPALGVGILVQAWNLLDAWVLELYNSERDLSTLDALEKLEVTGREYLANFNHVFAMVDKNIGKHKNNIAARMPSFEFASNSITQTAERVNGLIEARKERFVHRTAAAGAILGLVVLISPLKTLEPQALESQAKPEFAVSTVMGWVAGMDDHIPETTLKLLVNRENTKKSERACLLYNGGLEAFKEGSNYKSTIFDTPEEKSAALVALNTQCQFENIHRLLSDGRIGNLNLDAKSLLDSVKNSDEVRKKLKELNSEISMAIGSIELDVTPKLPENEIINEIRNNIKQQIGKLSIDGQIKLSELIELPDGYQDSKQVLVSEAVNKLPETLWPEGISLPTQLSISTMSLSGKGEEVKIDDNDTLMKLLPKVTVRARFQVDSEKSVKTIQADVDKAFLDKGNPVVEVPAALRVYSEKGGNGKNTNGTTNLTMNFYANDDPNIPLSQYDTPRLEGCKKLAAVFFKSR